MKLSGTAVPGGGELLERVGYFERLPVPRVAVFHFDRAPGRESRPDRFPCGQADRSSLDRAPERDVRAVGQLDQFSLLVAADDTPVDGSLHQAGQQRLGAGQQVVEQGDRPSGEHRFADTGLRAFLGQNERHRASQRFGW